MTTTPPPSSNARATVSRVMKSNSRNAQHPLPARPPFEVCVDGDS
ncbi:hypothetical protein PENANT_c044G00763 [Penicillium antarcticum]|uniref:Uncharacterized protein n=1 Tax=Penicillium antarcticum TaxID=416450 RepID=A0A1V6PRX0_9EURO|nr:hypothetical protein PENANT_c044G00763 [Penicillium antarcticum]